MFEVTNQKTGIYKLDPPLNGEEYVCVSSIYNEYAQEICCLKATKTDVVEPLEESELIKKKFYNHKEYLKTLGYEVAGLSL